MSALDGIPNFNKQSSNEPKQERPGRPVSQVEEQKERLNNALITQEKNLDELEDRLVNVLHEGSEGYGDDDTQGLVPLAEELRQMALKAEKNNSRIYYLTNKLEL